MKRALAACDNVWDTNFCSCVAHGPHDHSEVGAPKRIGHIGPMADHLRYRGAPSALQHAVLEKIVRADPVLMSALKAARQMAFTDWMVVSGAIYNTVWNHLTGRPSMHGVKDIDLFYCDGSDLSYEAEDRVIADGARLFAGLPVPVEIRNQARVHLWYESHFGTPCSPIASCSASLERFASLTHAVGVYLDANDTVRIEAPFGLEPIFAFRLVPNRATHNRTTHELKAARQIRYWPELEVVPW